MTTPAWIGLGSNLGDRGAILGAAIAALAGSTGVVVKAVSTYRETRPVGGPPGQGPFLNAAAHLETTLDPHQLLSTLQRIEHEAGRVRAIRWGERTLDLDILIFGTKFLETGALKVPHPRLALRRFVLAPLAEIAPTVVDAVTGRTVAELLANIDRRPRLLAIDGRDGRRKSTVFGRLVGELPGFGISAGDLGPPPDPAGGTVEDPLEILGRKAAALGADGWEGEALRVSWIVADFHLGLDLLRSSAPRRWGEGAGPDEGAKMGAYRDGMRRARSAARAALMPTLVLILPGGPGSRRRPGLLPDPQLRPESDEPAAIVDEVLATCRSIEGV